MKSQRVLKSAQDIFAGMYRSYSTAIIQKMRPDEHNLSTKERNYTEHWQLVGTEHRLLVIALGVQHESKRDLWAGRIEDVNPSGEFDDHGRPLYRIGVDRFQFIGIHDRRLVSDAEFYGNGGGGGSRVIAYNVAAKKQPTSKGNHGAKSMSAPPPGEMDLRHRWVRLHHEIFRDRVWAHWGGRCAVTDHKCGGHLVASHILPWKVANPTQKTDIDNGLLLTPPLDFLFDRGYISFANDGSMLRNPMPQGMAELFALKSNDPRIRHPGKLTPGMRSYLARHREHHGFPFD
ncbi:HNH endonuclease [Caballeronia sp. SEWSISQ10-4 2]|uniref:HNH endonuclease n=1 Tax=Caballeronia sp. SEWSISQ10-4 2 TaxID=2937438 RepID=UPI0026542A19|nr:HNH endonuclease signature motif containing protein [Caballeronia sp. SEWSISQ10-4 2]MDN7182516.1 HNH endonuclease [Caballeronia sp. SEWSISQ10-4 2]